MLGVDMVRPGIVDNAAAVMMCHSVMLAMSPMRISNSHL